MKGAKKGKPVKLSAEDRARMSRLYEETLSKLREMNLIISRNLNKTVSTSKEVTLEAVTSMPGGGGGTIVKVNGGCYDYKRGLCYPC